MADPVPVTLPQRLMLDCEPFHASEREIKADMRCHAPGLVLFANLTNAPASFAVTLPNGQTYNGTCQPQCAVVQPCLNEVLNIGGQVTYVTLPVLLDCPICMYRAGGFMITLPITAGDECLIHFGDACIDSWWQNGAGSAASPSPQNPMDLRRHDLSDGHIEPVIWSQPRKITNWSTNSVRIRNEANTNFIDLSATALTLQFGASSIVINASGIAENTAGTISRSAAVIEDSGGGSYLQLSSGTAIIQESAYNYVSMSTTGVWIFGYNGSFSTANGSLQLEGSTGGGSYIGHDHFFNITNVGDGYTAGVTSGT
jgi:hypothetical protein